MNKEKYKLKSYLICNTYDLTKYEVEHYKINKQFNRKTHELIINPTWHIFPIKNYFEYKWL